MKITISSPADRTKPGFLVCGDFGCPCYLKADNAAARRSGNASRDPLKRNGDTPLGVYWGVLEGPWEPIRSYGPYQVIALAPIGGDALIAHKAGRRGLAIHGGAPAADGRSFRPTHGCVRVRNHDMRLLLDLLKASGDRKHEVEIVEMADASGRAGNG